MNKKYIVLFSLLLVSVVTLLCIVKGGKTRNAESTQNNNPNTSVLPNTDVVLPDEDIYYEGSKPSDQDAIKTVPTNINPLTGLGDMSEEGMGSRPVAVMINNVKECLPQYGISKADIIFEIPVEGNLTRLMALYADYTQVPYICSVRSCREYFPAFSEGFDAIYVCWGGSKGYDTYLKNLGTTVFNGFNNTGGLFGRDKERLDMGYAKEHTSYFDGRGLADAVKRLNVRINIEADKQGEFFEFYDYFQTVKPSDRECVKLHINFGANSATFIYDENTKLYFKEINGNKQMDGVTGEQLSFTNVFLLETSVTMNADGLHKDVLWKVENGKGYYLSNGCMKEIYWSKTSESAPLKFYDENGKELLLNRGKTYIGITNAGRSTFE